ncbi:unnamed protein product [Calicophoron daubneyi]|uniref:RNA helicase n=1 Tax=Calicophoron daubneyi TaxID=300641 RepID=A0AAV2TWG5_CALDB
MLKFHRILALRVSSWFSDAIACDLRKPSQFSCTKANLSSDSRATLLELHRVEGPSDKKAPLEPRGYVTSHRWMKTRPADEKVRKLVFGDIVKKDGTRSEAEEKFLKTDVHATISGVPTKEKFTYQVSDSISELPNLDVRLRENLETMGLDRLTPVQRHAIGILSIDEYVDVDPTKSLQRVVGKYDLMAAAQTGSGKTLAYLIPMVNRILRIYPYEAMQAKLHETCQFPSGLVLAPTRELVQQILSELGKLCYRCFLRPVSLYGGERPARQMFQLSQGAHLIIATPGRLLDFLRQKALRLNHCRALVLDEADRMLDMGFEEQLREILQSPEFGMPPSRDSERQTSLYSATYPREVSLLARNFLRGSRCISLSISDEANDTGTMVPDWGKTGPKSKGQDQELARLTRIIPREIVQRFEMVKEPSKDALYNHIMGVLRDIKSNQGSGASGAEERSSTDSACRVLIFCNTKREVDRVDAILYRSGFACASLHGDKSQAHRDRALELFRQGTADVLVASSVAARGLDIPNVRAVINIGLPREVDDYVHRIGRTGRMGHTGQAVTLLTDDLLHDTPRHVAYGVLRLVHSSAGSVDQIPNALLQLARWNSGEVEVDESDHSRSNPRKKPGFISASSYYDKSRSFNGRRFTRHSDSDLYERYK